MRHLVGNRRRTYWCLFGLLVASLACNIPGLQVQPPEPTRTLRQTLHPAGAITGQGGLTIQAPPGVPETETSITIESINEPSDISPLPGTAEHLGAYYWVSSPQDIWAAADGEFVFRLPVPEGSDTEHLALAVLEPSEAIITDSECLVDQCSDIGAKDQWIVIDGQYLPDTNEFQTTLPLLAEAGRLIALVVDPDFNSAIGSAAVLIRPADRSVSAHECGLLGAAICQVLAAQIFNPHSQASSASFTTRCLGFNDPQIDFDCTATDQAKIEGEAASAYADLTGIGFAEPFIRTGSDDAYLLDIRPRTPTTSADIGLCEYNDDARNNGRYSSSTKTITVCIGDTGAVDVVLETTRHEYFHATQYSYSAVLTNSREAWIIEGTATTAENSLDSFARDASRDAHPVESSLQSYDVFEEYEAQDFWVYMGLRYEQSDPSAGLDYLIPIFRNGADSASVDSAMTTSPELSESISLADAYWEWAQNQTYWNQIDIGVGGPTGQLASEIASTISISYDPQSSSGNQTVDLEPLTSAVVELNYLPGSDPYSVRTRIRAPGSAVRSRYYGTSGYSTASCQGSGQATDIQLNLAANDSASYYVLISNTDYSQSVQVAIEFEEPGFEIVRPADDSDFLEGDQIVFQAAIEGICQDDELPFQIRWIYPRYDGVPFTFGNTENREELVRSNMCDGQYRITAEARDPVGPLIGTDQITIGIGDLGNSNPPPHCAPSISIDRPIGGRVYQPGTGFILRASIDDDHPETSDPLYPVIWRNGGPDGTIISRGLNGSVKLGEGDHQLYVSYGSASDQVVIEVSGANTPPEATILSPDDGDQFQNDGNVPVTFSGRGTDAEDGELPGSALTWRYKPDGQDWVTAGNGKKITITFPGSCNWTNYTIELIAVDSQNGEGYSEPINIAARGPIC